MPEAIDADADRPPTAANAVVAQLVVLDRAERRLHRSPAPAGRAPRLPVGIVFRLTADVDHPVDGRRTAEPEPAHPDLARRLALDTRLRHGEVPGVLRVHDELRHALRHADQRAAVIA